jgi:hypothetical protein
MNQWQRLVVTHGLLWNVVSAGVAVTFDIGYSVHIPSILLSPSLTARLLFTKSGEAPFCQKGQNHCTLMYTVQNSTAREQI